MAGMAHLGSSATADPPVPPPPGEGAPPGLASADPLAEALPRVRRLVAARTARMPVQPCDREEIVSDAMVRLVCARERRGERDLPKIAPQNVEWAIADFREASRRNAERERPTAPEEIPETAVEGAEAALERADAIREMLDPLSELEREMIVERYVQDLDAAEVAARHGMTVAAVKMACSRATCKVREAHSRGDGTFAGSAPVEALDLRAA